MSTNKGTATASRAVSTARSEASIPGSFNGDDEQEVTVIGRTEAQGTLGTMESDPHRTLTTDPVRELKQFKEFALRYRAERNEWRATATRHEEELAHERFQKRKVQSEYNALEEQLAAMKMDTEPKPEDVRRPEGGRTADTMASGLSNSATWRSRGKDPTKALTGEDQDAYKPWRYQVDRKIDTDFPLYPTEQSQFDYALSQMEEPLFSAMQGWVADEINVTYLSFMTEVEHYMGLHLQERDAKKELLTIKQRQDEGITEYYHRIRTIWQKAKATEYERIDKFLTTMLPSLSGSLLSKNYANVRDVLDDARTVEDRKKDIQSNYPRYNRKDMSGSTAKTTMPGNKPLTRPGAIGTSAPNSNSPRSPNTSFGPVAKKPDGWVGTWYDPVRNPRKMDAEEKTSMTRQGRCWMCRGSGHRSADTCCPFHVKKNQERKLNAMATGSLSEESSDEEAPGKA
jgi:hypothetical protein